MTTSTTPVYSRTMRFGNLLFVSGQLPIRDGAMLSPGKVGAEVTVEQAREAAVIAADRCLEAIIEELGSLDDVVGIAKVGGFVSVGGDVDVPRVIDAASQHIIEVLGDRGRHARAAVGVAALPASACVEIEMVVAC